MCQLAGSAPALGQWRQVLPGAGGPGPRATYQMVFSKGKRERTRTTLHQILNSFIQRMYRVFSVVLNRMCVPSTCSRSPAPTLPNRAGGLALNSSPATPSLGRVQRKAWERAFLSSAPSFLPLKGGLGHFLPSSSSQKPLLSPVTFLLWNLPPPQSVGRWSVQAKGDTVRVSKLSFFPACLSVSLKKKSYSSAYPWDLHVL